MKLAYISPLSPLRTGISDFSENLLPYLAERCKIKLFTDGYSPASTPILRRFPVADISEFYARPTAFDAVLYHMGNHYKYHRRIFEALWKTPGVVMLHDCVLNEFFAKYSLERGNFGIFRRLFKLCHPAGTEAEVAQFFVANADPYRFPMSGVVAMCSRGTIVMTDYGRDIVLREAPGARVLTVRFPYFETREGPQSGTALRKQFNIPEGCFVVTSVGHITPAKRIDVALEAFQKFHEKFPGSVFLLAGELSARVPIARLIERRSLGNVRYLGYLHRAELDGLMEVSDVCINLRYPSKGEMSSSLIDMLGCGKVVAVSNYAQFAEFPDDICVKINFGPNESSDLADALLELARNSEEVRRIGSSARKYITQNHSPDSAAEVIVNFIESTSKVEPSLSPEDFGGLLVPDLFPKRYAQMAAYNVRRLLSYANEHGVGQALRTMAGHAAGRRNPLCGLGGKRDEP